MAETTQKLVGRDKRLAFMKTHYRTQSNHVILHQVVCDGSICILYNTFGKQLKCNGLLLRLVRNSHNQNMSLSLSSFHLLVLFKNYIQRSCHPAVHKQYQYA